MKIQAQLHGIYFTGTHEGGMQRERQEEDKEG